MKTAIYIEDGVVQLVLTPDNEFEKNALRSFEKDGQQLNAKIHVGQFYDCRGGWARQSEYKDPYQYQGQYFKQTDDRSLIIRLQQPC